MPTITASSIRFPAFRPKSWSVAPMTGRQNPRCGAAWLLPSGRGDRWRPCAKSLFRWLTSASPGFWSNSTTSAPFRPDSSSLATWPGRPGSTSWAWQFACGAARQHPTSPLNSAPRRPFSSRPWQNNCPFTQRKIHRPWASAWPAWRACGFRWAFPLNTRIAR